jgi:hypothetical protein
LTRAETLHANAQRTPKPKYFGGTNAKHITLTPEYSAMHAKRTTPEQRQMTREEKPTRTQRKNRKRADEKRTRESTLRKYALIPAYFCAALSAKYRAPA